MKLTPVDRQTWFLVCLAYFGAQIPGLLSSSSPVRSFDCLQPFNNRVEAKTTNDRPAYYEHDPWKDAPEVPASSSKVPANGLTVSDAEIDQAIANERKQQQQEQHSVLPIMAPAQAAEPANPYDTSAIDAEVDAGTYQPAEGQ